MPVDLVGALVGWLVSVAGDAGIRLVRRSSDQRALSRAMGLAIDKVVEQTDSSYREPLRLGLQNCFSVPSRLGLDASTSVSEGLRAAISAQVAQLDAMAHGDTGQPFYQVVPVDREWLIGQVPAAIVAALRQLAAATGGLAGLVQGVDAADVLARVDALVEMARIRPSGGVVQQWYFHGELRRLRDVTMDLDPLPGDMGLVNPIDPEDLLGSFTGREWLIERIDEFIAECLARRVGGYLLVEAEAGMGKSALATYLAFTRAWPTHITRLPGGTSPEGARTNLVAQLIARWELYDATLEGGLPPGHDTTSWLYKQLCGAARRRDATEPTSPVVLLVDGLDEAPPAVPPQLPLGLPPQLPPGTVVVATTRPGTQFPAGMRIERIDVEGQLNRDDLLTYLRRITVDDQQLAGPLAEIGMDREEFCRTLLDRSGGVWIYALSVLDQIRDQRRSPAEIDTLPPSLAGYYANNITRLQTDPTAAWEDVALPLLCTLAAAREPQPAAVLAHWAGIELAKANRLLRGPFKAFLMVRKGGDPDVYALRHQSLRDLLEGRLPAGTDDDQIRYWAHDLAEATSASHTRIVEALLPDGDSASRNWGAIDGYTRAHLAEHAALGGQLDDLALDPQFLLLVGMPEFLRLRRYTQTAAGIGAIASLELASNSWSEQHHDRLHWLEVSARKVRCESLAQAVTARLDASWHCRTAFWSGSSHRRLIGHTARVWALAVLSMADGTTLLASAGDDRAVRLWDSLGGTARAQLTSQTGTVRALAAVPMPEGATLLVVGDGRAVRLWDPVTATLRRELTGHIESVRALAAVPMPKGATLLASGSRDGTVRLWDPVTGTLHAELTGHNGTVRALAAVPMPEGATLLAVGHGRAVRLWDPVTGAFRAELTGHTGWVRALAVVPMFDGTMLLASGGRSRAVRLWDAVTGASRAELTGHIGSVQAVVAVPMSERASLLASAGDDRSVRLWDPTARAAHAELTGHTGPVHAVAAVAMPKGPTLLASGGRDRTVRLWDPVGGTVHAELIGHTGPVHAVTAVPTYTGSTLLASASADCSVRLWDPTARAAHAELTGHTGPVHAVAAVAMPKGPTLLASGGRDRTVRLWDPVGGTVHAELIGHIGWVHALAAVPMFDGTSLLASAGHDGAVRLWDPVTRTAHAELIAHTGPVWALAAVPMPDGGILLASAGSDRAVRLWDPDTATPRAELTGHTSAVWALAAVSMPDGTTLLASGGRDCRVRLWDPVAATPYAELTGHTGPVRALATLQTSEGTLLATASNDGAIIAWKPHGGHGVGVRD